MRVFAVLLIPATCTVYSLSDLLRTGHRTTILIKLIVGKYLHEFDWLARSILELREYGK